MTTEIETFSQCTVVLVATLTLMQRMCSIGYSLPPHQLPGGLKTLPSIWRKIFLNIYFIFRPDGSEMFLVQGNLAWR